MRYAPLVLILAAAIGCALIVRDGMIRSSANSPAHQVQPAQVDTARVRHLTPSPFEVEYPGDFAATLKKKDDGHYWASALVNGGYFLDFMVDTGASICVLTPADARKLGIDYDKLEKDLKIRTAGGVVHGASVTLERITVGQVTVQNVDAVILDDHLDQSLLGMSFLERLSRWEVSPRAIIIRQ